jgi:hypothetical protein
VYFEVDFVIAGEDIVIGAFGIMAVNARMRALLGVTVSALASTAVSAVVYVIDSYMPSGILGVILSSWHNSLQIGVLS